MSIKSFNLAWVSVKDFKKAISFYRDTLGLKVREINETYGWAEFVGNDGGAVVGIGVADIKESVQAGQNAVMTFTVDDIVKSKTELSGKGVKMIGEIIEIPNIVKLQTFVDIDGNHAQLVELLHKSK